MALFGHDSLLQRRKEKRLRLNRPVVRDLVSRSEQALVYNLVGRRPCGTEKISKLVRKIEASVNGY